MTMHRVRFWLLLFLLLAAATPGCRQSPPETDEPPESQEAPHKPGRKRGKVEPPATDEAGKPAETTPAGHRESVHPEELDQPHRTALPGQPPGSAPAGETEEAGEVEEAHMPGQPATPVSPSPVEKASDSAEGAAAGSASTALPAPPVRIPVTDMLSTADLTMTLTDRGWLSYGPVAGLQTSIHYNSVVYRIVGSRRFVALQVWAFDQPVRAIERWNQLYATYPNVQDIKGQFAQMLFYSSRKDVHQMVMVEPNRNMVLALSCSVAGCSQGELLSLSAIVYQRTRR